MRDAGYWMMGHAREGGLEDAGDEGIISFLLIFFPSRSRLNERVARVRSCAPALPTMQTPAPPSNFQLPSKQAQTWRWRV
jgi:3-phenylpropionate/cinnamic acid dioxygenase small subunit